MLKCESIQSQSSAYVDREMPLWKIQLIKWHLSQCPTCAHEVMRLKQTDEILHQLESIKTSEMFPSNIMHQASEITANEKLQTSLLRQIWRHFEAFVAWPRYSALKRTPSYAFVVTFAVLLIIGTFATLYYPRDTYFSSDVTPFVAQSAAEESELVWIDIIPVDSPKRYLSIKHTTTQTSR